MYRLNQPSADDRKRNLAFQAKIHHNGAGLSLGHFDYADDAARAW